MSRACSACGEEKGADGFYGAKRQCKECILKKRSEIIRTRVCRECGAAKPHTMFPKHDRTCRRCSGVPDPAPAPDPGAEAVHENPSCPPCPPPPTAWLQRLLRKSRFRAMRLDRRRFHEQGYEFDVDLEHCARLWEGQGGLCALSGLEMTFAGGRGLGRAARLQNASLDRVDSSRNYSKANTQLVCMAPNVMKASFSTEELVRFARGIVARHAT